MTPLLRSPNLMGYEWLPVVPLFGVSAPFSKNISNQLANCYYRKWPFLWIATITFRDPEIEEERPDDGLVMMWWRPINGDWCGIINWLWRLGFCGCRIPILLLLLLLISREICQPPPKFLRISSHEQPIANKMRKISLVLRVFLDIGAAATSGWSLDRGCLWWLKKWWVSFVVHWAVGPLVDDRSIRIIIEMRIDFMTPPPPP